MANPYEKGGVVMANEPARGRLLAQKVADMLSVENLDGYLGTLDPPQSTAIAFEARRSRVPKVVLAELGEGVDVTVAALTKAGDEQDRGSELLLYGLSVGVTAVVSEGVGQASETARADAIEDLVEQIQAFLSDEARQQIVLDDRGAMDSEASLELPFVNDPVFNLQMIREKGIYQSISVFQYTIERSRQ